MIGGDAEAASGFWLSTNNADRPQRVFRRLGEFQAGAVDDGPLLEPAHLAVRDAPLDDHGNGLEHQPEVVERSEVQRETGLDQGAALAEIEDDHRLVDRTSPVTSPGRGTRSASRV